MKNSTAAFLILSSILIAGCAKSHQVIKEEPKESMAQTILELNKINQLQKEAEAAKDAENSGDIVKVKIETTAGVIEANLFKKEVPKTVENFVTLAKKGFYDGIIFHRVIPNFMIQTGDPTGTGRGGPGYQFADEFSANLRHTKAGILSMANSGPGTNGSQFFITEAATPWLDNRHSIFGEVTSGIEIVHKIANSPRDSQDKPLEKIAMTKVTVVE